MKQIFPVIAVCLAIWGLVALTVGASKAVFFGMLGPLVAVAATWVVTTRTYRSDPARVGPVLMAAFGVKMLFFGGYVAVVTQLLDIQSVAFVVSFVAYFIALYVVQALLLRRLTWAPVA